MIKLNPAFDLIQILSFDMILIYLIDLFKDLKVRITKTSLSLSFTMTSVRNSTTKESIV